MKPGDYEIFATDLQDMAREMGYMVPYLSGDDLKAVQAAREACGHAGAILRRPRAALSPRAKCPECGRVFDLENLTDIEEWSYGHDCEG